MMQPTTIDPMYDERPTLAQRIGRLLRLERERARLTQEALAIQAGVSQQYVSRLETGATAPTTTLVERLFDALGQQLRLDIEPRDADLDAAIDLAIAEANAANAANATDTTDTTDTAGVEPDGLGGGVVSLLLTDLACLLRRAPELPYLVDGGLAAALQGAPVRPTRMEVAVARGELPRLADWISTIPNCLRWVERQRDFCGYDRSPLRPGPLRWMTPFGELRVRLLDSLPAGIVIRAAGREVPVRPLAEVQGDDPQIARTVARATARSGARQAAARGRD